MGGFRHKNLVVLHFSLFCCTGRRCVGGIGQPWPSIRNSYRLASPLETRYTVMPAGKQHGGMHSLTGQQESMGRARYGGLKL